MDRQEEGAFQREQDIEAFVRHLPALSTERCPCSYVNLGRATFNREQDIKALWPEYVDDVVALEALVVVISCLNLAIWWCQHKRQYISLKPKGGKTRQESSKSGIMPESKKKKARSFRCTDYAKWKSMTRCVNR